MPSLAHICQPPQCSMSILPMIPFPALNFNTIFNRVHSMSLQLRHSPVSSTAITFFLILSGMLLTYRNIGIWLLAILLYWPMDVLSRTGLVPDCANADLVSEKLDCIALS